MVDLNLWQLTYPGTVLEFGTHESGHPFTRQVMVGPVDIETDDVSHPLSEGMLFGRDHRRGRVLEFAGAHLSTAKHPRTRQWVQPMDDSGVFEQAWRGDWLRDRAGRVATCANLDRGRLAYGRPRPYAPDHEQARQGWLTYACGFVTADDKFYDTTEQVLIAGVDPGEAGAFTFPMTFPFTGAAGSETRAWVLNEGTAATWPTITFRRGGRPRLELLDATGGVSWAVTAQTTLAYDESVTVDARPWVRSVKLNGSPASGLLRGSSLDQLRIPPGTSELRLVADDPSGLAEVEVRWRSAWGTL